MRKSTKNIGEGILGPKGKLIAHLLFYLGLLGALGLRLVLILFHINDLYAKIAWYFSMIILVVFYFYRLKIENKRRKMVVSNKLVEKVKSGDLNDADKSEIAKILNSILISKLRLNFFILFWMSIIALAVEIVIDLKLFK